MQPSRIRNGRLKTLPPYTSNFQVKRFHYHVLLQIIFISSLLAFDIFCHLKKIQAVVDWLRFFTCRFYCSCFFIGECYGIEIEIGCFVFMRMWNWMCSTSSLFPPIHFRHHNEIDRFSADSFIIYFAYSLQTWLPTM